MATGVVGGIALKNGNVQVALEIERDEARAFAELARGVETRLRALPGVVSATVVLTAERAAGAGGGSAPPTGAGPAARGAPPMGAGPGAGPGPGPRGLRTPGPALLPDVAAVIAVASGKGGVGKSTVAANLAAAMAATGARVGLLDADIYGPSVPRLMGVKGRPRAGERGLIPPMAHGVAVMSMGFLVDEEAPMIWRGPMVQSALQQLMSDVAWGELDLLVVDLPPGTGDAQLTMAQKVPLKGAVIVSTPQDLALADARKAINMFKKVDVPILGIIENMSYFVCPHCGERSEIFAHGGARECSAAFEAPFLGEIPLDLELRRTSDAGTPITVADPQGPVAAAFAQVAASVKEQLGLRGGARPAPKIVYD